MVASVDLPFSISAHDFFRFRLLLQLPLLDILCHDVVMKAGWDGWIERLCTGYERTHNFLVYCLVVDLLAARGNQILVNFCHVYGKGFIFYLVMLVKEEEYQIKTGKQSLRKVDVFLGRLGWIISTIKRIGCSKNRCPCVEAGSDTCFRNRHRLLLHDFVDVGSVSLVHLVKLVYATDSCICQYKSSSFKDKLTSYRIF